MLQLILISIIILFLWMLTKKPLLTMWVLVFLITDPGGFFAVYLTKGSLIGGLYYFDIFYFLIFISIFFNHLKINVFFKDKKARNIFWALVFFLIYQLVVFGYIVPEVGPGEYWRYFILRSRFSIITFFLIIPVYLTALKNIQIFFKVTVLLGGIVIILFTISALTGLEIVPIRTAERYAIGGTTRVYLYSRGLLYYLIPFGLIVYLTKIKLNNRVFIIIIGVLSLISSLVTLTKGVFIFVTAQLVSSAYIIRKILKISISRVVRNSILFVFVLIVLIGILMPGYIGHISRSFSDIIDLGTKGKYEDREESRAVREVPAMLYMIGKRPLFGTGYAGYKTQLTSKKFGDGAYDSSDVSFLANIMQYGIIGFFIYMVFYYKITIICIRLIRIILKIPSSKLINEYKYEFIFAVTSISFFVANFAKIHNFTYELVSPLVSALIFINVGILLACYKRFKELIILETKIARNIL